MSAGGITYLRAFTYTAFVASLWFLGAYCVFQLWVNIELVRAGYSPQLAFLTFDFAPIAAMIVAIVLAGTIERHSPEEFGKITTRLLAGSMVVFALTYMLAAIEGWDTYPMFGLSSGTSAALLASIAFLFFVVVFLVGHRLVKRFSH